MEFVSKDQQKKMEFVPLPIKEVKQPTSNILQNSAGIIWWWAVTLWGSYVWGKILEKTGKWIYGLTLPPPIDEAKAIQAYKAGVTNVKPRLATDVLLDMPIIQKTPLKQVMRSPSSTLWWIWTRSMIGTQAERSADQIYKKTINPIFKELDKTGIQLDTKNLVQEAKESILKSKKYSPSQIEEIVDNINEMSKNYKPSLSVKELDLEKQAIAGKIPQKYQTMPKLPNEAKVAQKELAWTFRKAVHRAIKKASWVDSAKLYQDYASLKWISQIGPKSTSQSWLSKWFGGFRSTFAQELTTPITTTTGKLTYKAWKMLQYLPSELGDMVKQKATVIKWIPFKDIVGAVIKEAPAGMLLSQLVDDIKKQSSPEVKKANAKQLADMIKNWQDINSFKTQMSFADPVLLTVVKRDIKKWKSKEDVMNDLYTISQ